MLRIESIDFYINEEHYNSGLPPTKTIRVTITGETLPEIRQQVDAFQDIFAKTHNISKPIAQMGLVIRAI